MKQYFDLKSKYPDAILLFRCGDFYESYEDDAKVVSEVLGITLTKRTSSPKCEGYMAGFPYHALDTYLPKLTRAGKRVAICDQLEPPKPTKKSAVSELINNLTTNNRTNNSQTTGSNMKLTINNQKNESANVQNAQVNNPVVVAAGSKPMTAEQYKEEPVEDAEFEEVKEDTPAPLPAKKPVTIKRKKTEPKSETPASPRHTLVPYTNKQGETGYFLFGFASPQEAKSLADRMAKSVKEGARYENHVRYDVVGFPPRYAQTALQMCEALNRGDQATVAKLAAATFDIYSGVVTESKAKREAARTERKEAEAKARAKEVAKVKAKNGLYSKEDVAAMLNALINDKNADIPEDIKKLMEAA